MSQSLPFSCYQGDFLIAYTSSPVGEDNYLDFYTKSCMWLKNKLEFIASI